MAQREYEFVSLSRDTTEADLKQRREIVGNSVRFVGAWDVSRFMIRNRLSSSTDQAALRAATEGRVLILEGIEKAERNILPLLNNLLENREMVLNTLDASVSTILLILLFIQALEDGRFLMNAKRYDKLLDTHSETEMKRLGLVRVNPHFRVIALALPVRLM